jgi:hypothetical protein
LQSVGNWWTVQDRRTLFVYLYKKFPFDANYLAAAPAATYQVNGDEFKISPKDIEQDALEIQKSKCSCFALRKLSFSFGKLNPRICYLCPYNTTYRNDKASDERRMLFYMLHAETHRLTDYIDGSEKKNEDVFRSYFRIYVSNTLIDAFPLSCISQEFLTMPPISYEKDRNSFMKELEKRLGVTCKQKIKYQRNKNLYMDAFPDYENQVFQSALQELSNIENARPDFGGSTINPIFVTRLFNVLSGQRKYVPLKAEEYMYTGRSFASASLPEGNSFFEGVQGIDFGIIHPAVKPQSSEDVLEPKSEDNDPSKGKSDLPNLDSEPDTDQELDCFIELEDDFFHSLPSYDVDARKKAIPSDESPSTTAHFSPAVSGYVEAKDERKAGTIDNTKQKDAPSLFFTHGFPDFYILPSDIEWLFFYNQNDEISNALISAVASESSYFCMEPVIYNNMEGILIMSSDKDFIFYPIQMCGPKIVRKLISSGIPIFTCNSFSLCRYLNRMKVYHTNPYDLSVAFGIRNPFLPNDAASIFSSAEINSAMQIYVDYYFQNLKLLSESQASLLELCRKFIPLLCSDGCHPPFKDLDRLFTQESALTYSQKFDRTKLPIKSGVFVSAKAESKICKNALERFMRACIDFEECVPFYDGRVNILSVSSSGLLVFLTGSEIEQTEMQLYFKASLRKAFRQSTGNFSPIKIEVEYTTHKMDQTNKGE